MPENVMITPETEQLQPEQAEQVLTSEGEGLQTYVMDWDKICRELGDKPEELKAVIEQYTQQISPLAIILTQNADNYDWCLFEGQVNLRRGTFKILVPIQVFKPNNRDPRRPPSQAMNMAASCAAVRKLPIWIP